ncbi:CRISPR-associated helicase/endonuclease Cas3 [Ferrimonas kyonanensis]|uniref:CRISPR-associated helicase/endonuclease Cas3 n=1 Tax=Ferrimonas kyonanensis TaxID=364763 RepID=UPI0003F790E0|nr:CRISPR-associated helicase/endonuclease Cas3 [Ferrimonas kyonanensis]
MEVIGLLQREIAHAVQDDQRRWREPHLLQDHLSKVSALCASFLSNDNAPWGELAGRWHDLGKYQAAFQDYIRTQSGFERQNAHIENADQSAQRVTHSTAGAMHAQVQLGPAYGSLLAYVIAGHHAGLPDWSGGRAGLSYRLGEIGPAEYQASIAATIPSEILQGELPSKPTALGDPDAYAIWIRMLFSALVDADFLDTESYMQPEQSQQRGAAPSMADLRERFDSWMAKLRLYAEDTPLNRVRSTIFDACIQGAEGPSGIFSLTVPTGGGKTLASLGFALEHAKRHNKRRIVYAIPFTSIIEQNAQVFRQVLGDDAVLEHHSNLEWSDTRESARSRLASENWDAPLVVTTNVQLFESLHASRTSRCRKLHNLQDAVIILDEAQQLPKEFHAPIVRSMQALSRHFGVTWLLCTATQPELGTQREAVSNRTLLQGLERVTELMPDPGELAQRLRRVEVSLPSRDEKISWETLAEQLLTHNCVLAIVSTRKEARELFLRLPDDGNTFHLSAQMCAEHRSHTLTLINERLQARREGEDNRPLRVISTQLIEAGVDVDFPVVYRAMAGLDSIAQSAGRCNREGKLSGLGKVVVFNPPSLPPPGFLRHAHQSTMALIQAGHLNDPLAPESFRRYFQMLNQTGSRDAHDINALLSPAIDGATGSVTLKFREAAKRFRLIDDAGVAVVVPYHPEGDIEQSPIYGWLTALEQNPMQRALLRKLQRYTVTLPEYFVQGLHRLGAVHVRAGLWVLEGCQYRLQFGICPPEVLLSAEASIC